MQSTRMPQGFKNSPGVFQRAMTMVLEGLIGKKFLISIDDILIMGKNFEDMKTVLDW